MTPAGHHRHRWVPMLIALALAVLATPFAGPTKAQPSDGSDPSTSSRFLKLTLDSVAPNTVTTSSDSVLTVTGTITNIGDRPVDDVSVRIQRAAAIADPSGLRSTLQLDQVNYDIVSPFQDVVERLDPGQREQFTVRVGVREQASGTSGTAPVTSSLGITDPGVYPLLLNVNGEPAYGNQARLDDARFLLPVLGLPPTSTDPNDAGAQAVPAATDAPVATSLVWPLADRPRRVGGITGSVDNNNLLTDDDLAGELAPGGRLDQLLSALESTLRPEAGRDTTHSGPQLADAICLAIDPDLLLTVSDMTEGYRVLASPSDPDGPTRDGNGAGAAQNWLNRLRALAPSVCTVALPYGQVDLGALAAVHDNDLSDRALRAPADIVDSLLSVQSVRGMALPASGSVDTGAADLLGEQGYTTALLADNAVAPADSLSAATGSGAARAEGTTVRSSGSVAAATDAPSPEMVRLPDAGAAADGAPAPESGLHAATFDSWSATALAAVGSNPATPPFTPDPMRYEVTTDSRTARLQDALGAVSWSAVNPQADRPRAELLMPPQQWGADRDEATALLDQLDTLIRSGLATPRPFRELAAQPPDPGAFDVNYQPEVATSGVPDQFVAPVQEQERRIAELMSALVEVPQQEPTPRQFVMPLRDDLIRSLTTSDRSTSGAQADIAAQRRIDQVTDTMDKLYRSVTVVPPGGVYTLASEQSPLLLVARNELPVAIRIRLRIGVPAETNITDIGEQQLPAEGTRSFQIPTQVSDSRNLVIPISIMTADGVALGDATSVSVRSNAYGPALAIITGCAGVLLFLLAGRRLWRRFRGRPDPADEGLAPPKRRRLNGYLRARKRVQRRQEAP